MSAKRVLAILLIAAGAAAAGAWFALAPSRVPQDALSGLTGDAARGERLFALGGCASCHARPEAEGESRRVLAGGRRFETEFGVFVAPNISPHPQAGIGGWSEADFVSALMQGTSPDGRHYYPAFPWPSYARMSLQEALDVFAHLRTLPQDPTPSAAHELGFPWNLRAGVGLWKALYLDAAPVVTGLAGEAERGRRLVEGIGHCAACHTPRDALGGPDLSRWLGGGPNPDGPGRIPDISASGLQGWTEGDVAYYLESGFTPEFDSVGGSMVAVVRATATLPPEDRAAIAAYLKAVPAANP